MLSKREILKKIEEYAPWGLKMNVADDIETPGSIDTEQRWDYIKQLIPGI